eukprot:gene1551-biopygen273
MTLPVLRGLEQPHFLYSPGVVLCAPTHPGTRPKVVFFGVIGLRSFHRSPGHTPGPPSATPHPSQAAAGRGGRIYGVYSDISHGKVALAEGGPTLSRDKAARTIWTRARAGAARQPECHRLFMYFAVMCT